MLVIDVKMRGEKIILPPSWYFVQVSVEYDFSDNGLSVLYYAYDGHTLVSAGAQGSVALAYGAVDDVSADADEFGGSSVCSRDVDGLSVTDDNRL